MRFGGIQCGAFGPATATRIALQIDTLFNNNNKKLQIRLNINGGSGGIKKQVIKCGLNL